MQSVQVVRSNGVVRAKRPFSSACWSYRWWRRWIGWVWRTNRTRWKTQSTDTWRRGLRELVANQAATTPWALINTLKTCSGSSIEVKPTALPRPLVLDCRCRTPRRASEQLMATWYTCIAILWMWSQILRKTNGVGENVEFCNSETLDQRRTLINRILRIEWYHLQAPTAIQEVPELAFATRPIRR